MSKEILNLVNEYLEIDKKVDSNEIKIKELVSERSSLSDKREKLFQEVKPILLNSEGILQLEKEDGTYAVIISKDKGKIMLRKLLTADEIDTKRIFNKLEGIQT